MENASENGKEKEKEPKFARLKLTPAQTALLQKAVNSASWDEHLEKIFPSEIAFFKSIFQKSDFFFVVYFTPTRSRSKYRTEPKPESKEEGAN